MDAYTFLKEDSDLYGVIIIDLPDPDTIDLMHLYSLGFYRLASRHLQAGGILTTQATSPSFSMKAFLCILKTVMEAGFTPLPYHNQIPTTGRWGWVLAVHSTEADEPTLKRKILKTNFDDLKTRFLNTDAVISMVHFGKGELDPEQMKQIKVNTQINPVLHSYYRSGAWSMY